MTARSAAPSSGAERCVEGRQQARAHGFLTQQLCVGTFTQGVGRGALIGAVQGHAVDAGGRGRRACAGAGSVAQPVTVEVYRNGYWSKEVTLPKGIQRKTRGFAPLTKKTQTAWGFNTGIGRLMGAASGVPLVPGSRLGCF